MKKIPNLTEGRDIRLNVQKINDRMVYKFSAMTSYESKKVDDKIIEGLKFWDGFKPLGNLFREYSHDDLRKILEGQSIQLKSGDTKKKAVSKASLGELYSKKMGISGNSLKNNNVTESDSLSEIESDPKKKG